MKILYIVPRANVGGLQTTLRSRINALKAFGIQSEVVFFEHGDGEYIFSDIAHSFISSVSEFQQKIEEGGYHYLSFIYAIKYLKDVPASYKGKIIYEVRGWSQRVERCIEQISKDHSVDVIICIAKYLKQIIKEKLGESNIPVYVDGNTVDPMFRYIRRSHLSWEDCPKPSKDRKVIGFVGRVESSKNWREFIEICSKLADSIKIEVWIICNPNTSSELPDLKKMCETNNLKNIIRIIGHVPNHYMPEVYSVIKKSGGCILSTSYREGLGNAVLEPMACRLPVVSSNIPGKNEIIVKRYNGMLYRLGNTDKAVRQVRRVLNDKAARKKIIRNGLYTIRKDFNRKKYVNRYMYILSQIK